MKKLIILFALALASCVGDTTMPVTDIETDNKPKKMYRLISINTDSSITIYEKFK